MSAYKRIECEFKDKESLLEALDFLDLDYKEYESPENLKGWKNDVRKEKAHIIIPKESLNKNLTGASNDVGFLWNEEEQRFEMICSQYDQSKNVDKKIIQSYAKSAIEKVLKENGFKTKVSIKKEDILNKKMQELKMTVRKIV
jgi:hypothetical protein